MISSRLNLDLFSNINRTTYEKYDITMEIKRWIEDIRAEMGK
jgi:hypothetical protein